MLFDGVQVNNPWVINLSLQNTGQIPVQKSDIEKPVTVVFKGAKVIDAQVDAKAPENLIADVVAGAGDVSVNHGLLNPGDKVDFTVVLDGEMANPKVLGRISDVASVDYRDGGERVGYSAFFRPIDVSAVAICCLVLLFLVFGFFHELSSRVKARKRLLQADDYISLVFDGDSNLKKGVYFEACSRDLPPDEIVLIHRINAHFELGWVESLEGFCKKVMDFHQEELVSDKALEHLYYVFLDALKVVCARHAYAAVPLGDAARDIVMNESVDHFGGARQFVNIVDGFVKERIQSHYKENPPPLFDRQAFIGMTALILVTASLAYVTYRVGVSF